MPLMKGKSEKAFSKNVATEMHAGKPQPQALAIAYSMKRKAQQKAKGGHVHGPMCAEGCMMAEGGQLTKDGYQSAKEETNPDLALHSDEMASGYREMPEAMPKHNEPATEESDRALNQHGEDEEGPQGPWMAEGGDPAETTGVYHQSGVLESDADKAKKSLGTGTATTPDPTEVHDTTPTREPGNSMKSILQSIKKKMAEGGEVYGMPTDKGEHREESFITDNEQSDAHMRDMVGRIMMKRQHMYSEGGKVANKEENLTWDMPNEFDDLALRDDLESTYTGANSGDEDGNQAEEKDRRDPVARIMMKRRSQSLPNTIPGNRRRG
jgi:hypothetical protein